MNHASDASAQPCLSVDLGRGPRSRRQRSGRRTAATARHACLDHLACQPRACCQHFRQDGPRGIVHDHRHVQIWPESRERAHPKDGGRRRWGGMELDRRHANHARDVARLRDVLEWREDGNASRVVRGAVAFTGTREKHAERSAGQSIHIWVLGSARAPVVSSSSRQVGRGEEGRPCRQLPDSFAVHEQALAGAMKNKYWRGEHLLTWMRSRVQNLNRPPCVLLHRCAFPRWPADGVLLGTWPVYNQAGSVIGAGSRTFECLTIATPLSGLLALRALTWGGRSLYFMVRRLAQAQRSRS